MYLTLPPLIPKKFNAIPENIKLINNGYTVQYNFNYGKQDRPTLSGGPLNDIYVVDHIHLHWGDKNYVGSEHQLNGKPYPLELHIVTQNTKYGLIFRRNKTLQFKKKIIFLTDSVADAKKYSDGLAVLGILYLVDSRTNQLSDEPKFPGLLNILNKTMSSENNFLKFLPNVINAGSEYTITEIFTLNEILKGLPLFYYTYKGSLTTPTCDESVTWMVLREPLLVKKTDMEMLRALKDKSGGFLLKNYRPIQKIKHRYVLRNC